MMRWQIPAKTFLIGEYAALTGAPAIILTTSPCFEMTLSEKTGIEGVHPVSPAGRWWNEQKWMDVGLKWHDPYHGRGGLGASTAQFLGAYLAHAFLSHQVFDQNKMLDTYLNYAWQGTGVKPSGYDLLAQSLSGCVYVERQADRCHAIPWPFNDLGFILLHTGQKLATHHHLQTLTQSNNLEALSRIATMAKLAFENEDSGHFIDAINAYYQQLVQLNRVAEHTLHCIQTLKNEHEILAIKGCGAMGADILLILTPQHCLSALVTQLKKDWHVIATNDMLYVN